MSFAFSAARRFLARLALSSVFLFCFGVGYALATNPITTYPASLGYGQVATTYSNTLTLQVTNNLSSTVSLSEAITQTGYSTPDFSVVSGGTCGTSLAANATCTLSVKFAPSSQSSSETGTLTITAGSNQLAVSLSGSGVAPLTVSRTSIPFGQMAVGNVVMVSTQLTNFTPVSMSLSASISQPGYSTSDFATDSSTTCGSSLAARSSCYLNIDFVPSSPPSNESATLTISGAGGTYQYSLAMTGAGVIVIVKPSPYTVTYGSAVTLTSEVIVGATGTVTFNDNGTAIGTSSIVGSTATYTTSSLAASANKHILTATYNGDSQYSPVTSSGAGVTVNMATPSVSLASSLNPSAYANTVTFTATLPSSATGTVTFKDGSTTLGSSSLSAGTATYTPTTLSVASHTISAVYGGDSNDYGSASNSVTQVVSKATPTPALSCSPNPQIYLQSVTCTATLPSAATGTVTFNDGGSALGTASLSGGAASYTTSSLTTGSNALTASYSGDSDYNAATSAAFTETINVPPSISGITPTVATVGNRITLTGANFGSSQGTSTLAFNGTAASGIVSWSSSSIIVAVPSGASSGNIVVTVGGMASNGVAFTVQPAFVSTSGVMTTSRYGHSATRLTSGLVLVAGGVSASGVISTAELYNSATQTFSSAGNMTSARWKQSATLLNDGTVLIAGGTDSTNLETLDTAEIYDPVAGTFTLLTATLNTARVGHTATLLNNGQVLIVGGYDPDYGIISDAELYDPPSQTFVDLGDSNAPRYRHTATLLQNGQVLIAGGEADPTPTAAYSSAEIFDLGTWTFIPVSASMSTGREGHSATLLNNGQVLVAGGDQPPSGSLSSAELYNPSANTFTVITATMSAARILQEAVLLNGGQVLIAGGDTDSTGGSAVGLSSAEIYDPVSQLFTATAASMSGVRVNQSTTLLNDGTVLELGGSNGTSPLNTAEIYEVSKLIGLASIAVIPATPNVPMGSSQLFVATGAFSTGGTQVLSSALWSSSATSVLTANNDGTDAGFGGTVAQGTATLTASAVGVSGSTSVTVTAPALASILVTSASAAIPLGGTQQLDALGIYTDGSSQDLTATATWTSSSGAVTVNSAGLATGATQGTATLQAASSSVSGSTTLTVGPAALVSLSVNPATSAIATGTTQQYQLVGTYTDGSTQNLTSSASWFAVPDQTALITTGALATGVGAGTADITASYGTLSASASLTVGTPSITSIVITPGSVTVPIGSVQQLIATATYSDGSSQDVTTSVSWASSTSSVATVGTSGLVAGVGSGSSTITASSGTVSGTAAISAGSQTLSLNTSRYLHNATLLDDGKVLFAGGVTCPTAGSCTYLNSAELYNPTAGTISTVASMAAARTAPSVLLGNGKVLIAGGYSCDSSGTCASLASSEIYDPVSGAFSSAGNMTTDRHKHTLTLLSSGLVLITGGESCSSATSCTALSSAELYDPVAGTFTATGALAAARFDASAVRLNSGSVLILGGYNGASYPAGGELYNPVTGTFSASGTLNVPRAQATATLLDNNYVFIAGGSTCGSPGCPTAQVELYTSGNFFSTRAMPSALSQQSATLLTNGQLLISGGFDACSPTCASSNASELYDPQVGTYSAGPTLSTGRTGHTATLLTDGSVLIAAGINSGVTQASTDSYQPSSLASSQLASIAITPSSVPITVGATVPLVATGYDSYGDLLGTLQSVTWNSSSPSVATVSNAAGSSGIVHSLALGTTTITASVGTISAQVPVTATGPLTSISINPPSPTIAINSSQQLQFTATGMYADGSTLDLSSVVTWSSSNTSVAQLFPSATDFGITIPVGVGTSNVTASYGAVTGTTALTVTAPPSPTAPVISSVSPTTGAAGTSVTINGSGFGSQTSGALWLGTTLGAVVSWSNTQITANVAAGSSSGVAQVQQNGVASNAISFTVNTATVTSVSPSSAMPGTPVTISGSGFGGSQGGGIVVLGTANAIVTSWSDSQVIATPASGALSGSAQVLQNGVWSNSLPFAVPVPQISGIYPNSGGTGTTVTISGSGFGNPQGSGVVWIGGAEATVSSWTDTEVVASVGATAVTGVLKVQQNGNWSNTQFFSVPPSGSDPAVTLVPDMFNMVVGQTASIQALDSTSQPITGLTWSSNNPSIVSLSTDDPPVITAVATGNVTITAGNASADVTVYAGSSLPTGTMIWSNPGDGSGVTSITPAVPSSSGVADVFAVQESSNVQAIKTDGTTAWTASVPPGARLIPDFQGGLLTVTQSEIQKLDGLTGNATSVYTYSNNSADDAATKLSGLTSNATSIHTFSNNSAANGYPNGIPSTVVSTDGTAFTVDGDKVIVVNTLTKAVTGTVPLDDSTLTTVTINGGFCYDGANPRGAIYAASGDSTAGSPGTTTKSDPQVGNLIIAGDGYAYLLYIYINETQTLQNQGCDRQDAKSEHLRLLRVSTTGGSNVFTLGDWKSSFSSIDSHQPGSVVQSAPVPTLSWADPVTNADIGVFLSWESDTPAYSPTGSGIVPASSTFATATTSAANQPVIATGPSVPGQATPLQAIVQRADSSYVGIVGVGPQPGSVTQSNMIAFAPSGTPLWLVLNDSPQTAKEDGGVIGASGKTYDQYGHSDGQMANLPVQSWTANAYRIGSVVQIEWIPLDVANSFAAFAGGNASGQGTSTAPFISIQEGLYNLAHANLKANSQCDAFLKNLAKGRNVSENLLITQLQTTASRARNYVYDGTIADKVQLTTAAFPDSASSGVTTVALWFAQDSNRQALSQYNGDAIFFRIDDWKRWDWSSFSPSPFLHFWSGKLDSLGMGTLMHETLHKQTVGGGEVGHCGMDKALGIKCDHLPTTPNAESDAIGTRCFKNN